jgi:hypothetical protein
MIFYRSGLFKRSLLLGTGGFETGRGSQGRT